MLLGSGDTRDDGRNSIFFDISSGRSEEVNFGGLNVASESGRHWCCCWKREIVKEKYLAEAACSCG